MREIRSSGADALTLLVDLLHRIRLADPDAGLWEAADPQWWSRRPQVSDAVEQVFWLNDRDQPVAAVFLTACGTSGGEDAWQCDPIRMPVGDTPPLSEIWTRALDRIRSETRGVVEVMVRDDDPRLQALATASGLSRTDDTGGTGWLAAADRPAVIAMPEGYVLVDRTQRAASPHPMTGRNGDDLEARLARTTLYEPRLDLAIETSGGQPAGYALFWADPLTGVGMIEPVRVEDDHQRRGLARAMLTAGIDRLASRGMDRIKVSWSAQDAAALYQGLGFVPAAGDTVFAGTRESIG